MGRIQRDRADLPETGQTGRGAGSVWREREHTLLPVDPEAQPLKNRRGCLFSVNQWKRCAHSHRCRETGTH